MSSQPVGTGGRAAAWVALGAGVVATGLAALAAADEAERRRHPPPGQLIDVGGFRLHLRVSGEGSPTVLLDTGLTGMSSAWGWIQPRVAKSTQVLSYDRGGLGWSDPAPEPRDGARMVDELGRLLDRAGLDGPFVLVGHSMGSYYNHLFYDRWPERVVGFVWLEPSYPNPPGEQPAGMATEQGPLNRALNYLPLLAKIGLVRFAGGVYAVTDTLPPEQAADMRRSLTSPRHLHYARAEAKARGETTAQVRAARDLDDRRLIILAGGDECDPMSRGYHNLYRELAALSTRGEVRIYPQSDHFMFATRPDIAQHTVDAIREVVEEARAAEG